MDQTIQTTEKQPSITDQTNQLNRIIVATHAVEDLAVEFEHMRNLTEVLEIGFINLHYSNDDICEGSCMHILRNYLQQVEDSYIVTLMAVLEDMRNQI